MLLEKVEKIVGERLKTVQFDDVNDTILQIETMKGQILQIATQNLLRFKVTKSAIGGTVTAAYYSITGNTRSLKLATGLGYIEIAWRN